SCNSHRASECRARRHPDQQTFLLAEMPRVLMCFFGADLKVLVRDRRIVDPRHDCRLHMFQTFESMKRRVWLKRDNPYLRIQLFQPPAGPNKRPARAQPRDKMSNPPGGLLPDFIGGRLVMRSPVR